MDFWDINQFAYSLQKARDYADNYKYKCCCPDCNEYAIKSHLIQRHPVLEALTDGRNKVLQFEPNWEDARSGRRNLYSLKMRGINDAMQYRLFCSKHDFELFKELEKNNSIPDSKRDCLLLAYRAACSVRHQEEMRLRLYDYKNKQDPNGVNDSWLKNSQAFIRRMDAVIENICEAINGDDGSYLFRLIAMPYIPVAASDCIVDEEDYVAHVMEEEYRKPLNCYFVNLIPDKNRLLLLLGCDARYDRDGEYEKIITEFPANCDIENHFFIETLWGILLKCQSWCCSPKLAQDSNWHEFLENYEMMKINALTHQEGS